MNERAIPSGRPSRRRRTGRLALVRVAAILLLLVAGCSESEPGTLRVVDAWIPPPPPGSPAAGYLVIDNGSDREHVLVAATSGAADRVELHRSREVDGVMRMEAVPTLPIPAGERVRLEPRGLHLMLLGPRPLSPGDRVTIALRFAEGLELEVEARVGSAPGEAAADAGHAGHGAPAADPHAGHAHPADEAPAPGGTAPPP